MREKPHARIVLSSSRNRARVCDRLFGFPAPVTPGKKFVERFFRRIGRADFAAGGAVDGVNLPDDDAGIPREPFRIFGRHDQRPVPVRGGQEHRPFKFADEFLKIGPRDIAQLELFEPHIRQIQDFETDPVFAAARRLLDVTGVGQRLEQPADVTVRQPEMFGELLD